LQSYRYKGQSATVLNCRPVFKYKAVYLNPNAFNKVVSKMSYK